MVYAKFMSIGLQLYEKKIFEELASFSKKQDGGKSHVTVKVLIREFVCSHVTDATQEIQLS